MPLTPSAYAWLALCALAAILGFGAALWVGQPWALGALVGVQVVFAVAWRRQLIPALTLGSAVSLPVGIGLAVWMSTGTRAETMATPRASQLMLSALGLAIVGAFIVQFVRKAPRRAATVSLAATVVAALLATLGTGWLVAGDQLAAGQHTLVRVCAGLAVVAGLLVQGAVWLVLDVRRLRRAPALPRMLVESAVTLAAAIAGAVSAWVSNVWLGQADLPGWGLHPPAVVGAAATAIPGGVAVLLGAGCAMAGCAGVRVAAMMSFRNISAPRPSLNAVQRLANPLTRLALGASLAVLLGGGVVFAAIAWLSQR